MRSLRADLARYISPVSPLYLPYISPISPLHLFDYLKAHAPGSALLGFVGGPAGVMKNAHRILRQERSRSLTLALTLTLTLTLP